MSFYGIFHLWPEFPASLSGRVFLLAQGPMDNPEQPIVYRIDRCLSRANETGWVGAATGSRLSWQSNDHALTRTGTDMGVSEQLSPLSCPVLGGIMSLMVEKSKCLELKR